jgi:hypothetical protein
VLHACKRVASRTDADEKARAELERLRKAIVAGTGNRGC